MMHGAVIPAQWVQRWHPAHRINRRTRPRRWDESSNSFAMFVVMLPLIIGAFGIGIDIARNVYIRTSLQNALDMATVGGAAVTEVAPGGGLRIDADNALLTTEQVYALNRASGPSVDCVDTPGNIPGTQLARCWRTGVGLRAPTVTDTAIYYSVRERSKNAFLPVLGVTSLVWQDYVLESHAVLKQSGE